MLLELPCESVWVPLDELRDVTPRLGNDVSEDEEPVGFRWKSIAFAGKALGRDTGVECSSRPASSSASPGLSTGSSPAISTRSCISDHGFSWAEAPEARCLVTVRRSAAAVLQAQWRGHVARHRFLLLRSAARILQRLYRAREARPKEKAEATGNERVVPWSEHRPLRRPPGSPQAQCPAILHKSVEMHGMESCSQKDVELSEEAPALSTSAPARPLSFGGARPARQLLGTDCLLEARRLTQQQWKPGRPSRERRTSNGGVKKNPAKSGEDLQERIENIESGLEALPAKEALQTLAACLPCGWKISSVSRVHCASSAAVAAYEAAQQSLGPERLLWHGTFWDSIPNIVQQGFNRAYAFNARHGSKLGHGVYFTEDPAYALRFADRSSKNRYLLLAGVLPGCITRGKVGLLEPPLMPGKSGLRFDSTADDPARPRVICVFRDFQALPLCVVQVSTS